MIRLEKVNGKNVWDILKLKVSDDQRNFAAGNDTSIIEAYTAIVSDGYVALHGIKALGGSGKEDKALVEPQNGSAYHHDRQQAEEKQIRHGIRTEQWKKDSITLAKGIRTCYNSII